MRDDDMSVRAKFKVTTKAPAAGGVVGAIGLSPVYSTDPNHENKTFWDATPSGKVELYISNPVAFAQFDLDAEYYIDFTKAE